MHLAFDAKRAFLNQTGLGNHNRTLLEGMFQFFPQENYHLYTPKLKDSLFLANCKAQGNVQMHLPQTKYPFYPNLWRTYFLGKTLKKDKPDVYHGLSHELPFDIQGFKGKKIVTIHDLIFMRYPKDYSWFDVKMHEQKVRFSCKAADIVIAVSQQTKQDLIEKMAIPEKKIEVIYPTIATEFQQNQLSPTLLVSVKKQYSLPDTFVLYVGSLTYRKNVKKLIEAISLLPKDKHLVIVGNGNEKAMLQDFSKEKGLENQVHFFSNIGNEELKCFYQLASIFVYPSLFEGFGLPIQEAMYNRLPIVAGNNSCFSEAGGKGGLYVNQESPAELAEAIQQIFENTGLRENLIEAGQLHLQDFGTERIVRQTMQLYYR